MGDAVGTVRAYRFVPFTLDPRTGELTSSAGRTLLRDQPFRLLLALLERPGQPVTREELTRRLWPSGVYIDFDQGLNKAVNHLRDVLGDSAEQPRFIETLPRKGYRFIAPVASDVVPVSEDGAREGSPRNHVRQRRAGDAAGPAAAGPPPAAARRD